MRNRGCRVVVIECRWATCNTRGATDLVGVVCRTIAAPTARLDV